MGREGRQEAGNREGGDVMKRNLYSLAAFTVVCFLFWVGGLEFERGEKQAWAMVIALYIGSVVFFLGNWEPRHD